MDFFAGSGTTLAVAHKMNRRWVGVEQMDYIKSVTKIRLEKVVQGEGGGVSKELKWQGGGSFVYFELASLNAKYRDLINKAQSTEELEKLFDKLRELAFIDYRVDIHEVLEDRDFKDLSFEDKKEILGMCLDRNMDYIPLGDIDDSSYGITTQTKDLNKAFYKEAYDE